MSKIQYYLTYFGLFTIAYNLLCILNHTRSVKGGIILIIEGILGIACLFLPNILSKIFSISFPKELIIIYLFFIFISVFLGTCLHLITHIPFYDKILHASSPILLTFIGYGLIAAFIPKQIITSVSPWLFLIFGMAFAEMCGVFWEFWEYSCDALFKMNLQRFSLSNGTLLVGRQALMDTMGDLLVNTLGALIALVYSFFKYRQNPQFFLHFEISIK